MCMSVYLSVSLRMSNPYYVCVHIVICMCTSMCIHSLVPVYNCLCVCLSFYVHGQTLTITYMYVFEHRCINLKVFVQMYV